VPAKGTYLAIAGFGGIFVWSALKGKSWSSVARDLVAGKNPVNANTTQQIQPLTGNASTPASGNSGGGGSGSVSPAVPSGTGSVAAYKVFARTLMVKHGWGLGQQWTDFQWVVMQESGWNNHATNPSSGAFGIAQALGHGTANTRAANGENNYGNFGTSDTVCRSANGGNGFSQLIWMCNYIGIVYGNPSNTRARYNQGY
jgi:hypothetical protein